MRSVTASVTDHTFGIRLSDCSKLAINPKMKMTSQFANMTASPNFFDVVVLFWSSLGQVLSSLVSFI